MADYKVLTDIGHGIKEKSIFSSKNSVVTTVYILIVITARGIRDTIPK